MGKKIFVSYKHNDHRVDGASDITARHYVEYLINLFEGDDIYKGEGDEDLSDFKEETIKTRLKDKIHDSSITLVLVSLGMKDQTKKERDQWIPWEISYSLKEIERGGKTSHPNAIIAVVLPDKDNSYSYYIENTCQHCDCRTLNTYFLFKIMSENTYNVNNKNVYNCRRLPFCNQQLCAGEPSYILSVKWHDFIKNKDTYIDRATAIRDDRKSYSLTKEIPE